MIESIRRKQIQIEKQMTGLEKRLSSDGVLLTPERLEIVEMKPMELLSNLRNGHFTAMKVLQAFQAKTLEVTRRINCITEFIPEAESFAEACDLLLLEDRGPLHGLPVSIKESIDIKGMDTTIGLAKHLYNPVSSNAVVVDVLIAKGAIPFCKTNIPQTMYSFCCSNPVYGTTTNPHDVSRIPGGSSGGEGALIGGGGSVLGIGTDLAGSIRIPSSISGCVGIKPTSGRLSNKGVKKILAGQRGVESTIGVMGRDVDIVTECMKVICGEEMTSQDISVLPLSWNDLTLTSKRKLRFGYFDNIEMFPTTPGVRRAVQVSKKALENAGHEVVPFEIENIFEILIEGIKILRADEAKTLKGHLNGEILEPYLWRAIQFISKPNYLKPYLKFNTQRKSKLAAKFIFVNECTETFGYWNCLAKRQKIIDGLMKIMKEKSIDLLLTPSYPIPAPQDGVPTLINCAYVYTMPFNYLNFPSGAVPVTQESEEDKKLLENYIEDDLLFRIAKKATRGATGLPLGVLISGCPWEEELVCRGMRELQEALKSKTEEEILTYNNIITM